MGVTERLLAQIAELKAENTHLKQVSQYLAETLVDELEGVASAGYEPEPHDEEYWLKMADDAVSERGTK